jgi:hypothetical protein
VKEGVLNQSPEFAKARKLANLNAASIFDLLCLAAGRWAQYSLVNDVSPRFKVSRTYLTGENYLTSYLILIGVRASSEVFL